MWIGWKRPIQGKSKWNTVCYQAMIHPLMVSLATFHPTTHNNTISAIYININSLSPSPPHSDHHTPQPWGSLSLLCFLYSALPSSSSPWHLDSASPTVRPLTKAPPSKSSMSTALALHSGQKSHCPGRRVCSKCRPRTRPGCSFYLALSPANLWCLLLQAGRSSRTQLILWGLRLELLLKPCSWPWTPAVMLLGFLAMAVWAAPPLSLTLLPLLPTSPLAAKLLSVSRYCIYSHHYSHLRVLFPLFFSWHVTRAFI